MSTEVSTVKRRNTLTSRVKKMFGGGGNSDNTVSSNSNNNTVPYIPPVTQGLSPPPPAKTKGSLNNTASTNVKRQLTVNTKVVESGNGVISPVGSNSNNVYRSNSHSKDSNRRKVAGQSNSNSSGSNNNSTTASSNPVPITTTTSTTTSNSDINTKRFVLLESGEHRHNLKATRRQEKLTSMLKNLISSQRVRDQAVSAVPDIITDPSLKTPTSPTPTPQVQVTGTVDSPSLLSGLVKRIEGKKTTLKDNIDLPLTPVASSHFDNKNPNRNARATINNNNNTPPIRRKDNQSFAEKYGKCIEIAGKGAYGVVRICHKKSLDKNTPEQLFAVKEFSRRAGESAEKYQKRLIAEFCISSSLHHTNIVETLDLLKDANGVYLEVMRYCAGGDLFSLIVANGKLEYLEADCFFKQLIRGVVYMHNMGVCHRDLKPENLLLTADGMLKITDFGNSECFKMAWEKDIHLSGGVCGSGPYIAPEEYVMDEFDPRAVDIWSCGVIYMAMRTGRQLWSVAKREDQFYSKYLKGRKEKGGYKPIEQMKRARCRNVIYSMLDPVPHRRITGKQILNSEWGREIKCCHESYAIKV